VQHQGNTKVTASVMGLGLRKAYGGSCIHYSTHYRSTLQHWHPL